MKRPFELTFDYDKQRYCLFLPDESVFYDGEECTCEERDSETLDVVLEEKAFPTDPDEFPEKLYGHIDLEYDENDSYIISRTVFFDKNSKVEEKEEHHRYIDFTVCSFGKEDNDGKRYNVLTGPIRITSNSNSPRPKPFDISIAEEEVEIGDEKGSVSVPTFENTVFFFNGEEWELDKNNVEAVSGDTTIYLQLKRTVTIVKESGARTYMEWESSLETELEEPEDTEETATEIIGIAIYELAEDEDGKVVVKLDKRDASIDLGKVVQTDGCSVEENTNGSLQIAGFTSSPVPSEMSTLAKALTADKAESANVLVQKDGKVGYLPIGNGIGGGTGHDDVSIGLNSDSKFEIKGFENGAAEKGYTLADKLAIEKDDAGQPKEKYDGDVLVRLGGSLVYVPVGCGLGQGSGGEITIQGTNGVEQTGKKIIFKAEDDTNITFKATEKDGVVTVKVGVYYRSGSGEASQS